MLAHPFTLVNLIRMGNKKVLERYLLLINLNGKLSDITAPISEKLQYLLYEYSASSLESRLPQMC